MAKTSSKPRNSNAIYAVYSTCTSGIEYVQWEQTADLPIKTFAVNIAGGAGVAQRTGLITPLGVKTEVTQDEMDFLNQNETFQRAVKDGWHTVIKLSGWMDDPDSVAAAMKQRDGSAPLVPNDFNHLPEEKRPIVNGARSDGSEPTSVPRSVPLPFRQANFGKAFRS